MLLRSIDVTNLRRFERLRLDAIPETGVIGIGGANETGKTTIGEAILFALFGRTVRSVDSPVDRLIRWGAEYLEAEVCFSVPGCGDYLVHREIDRYGTNLVKLVEWPGRKEIASGPVNVQKAVRRLAGYDLTEFVHSFYLGQGDDALAPTDPEFLGRAMGLEEVRQASDSVRVLLGACEREFAGLQEEIRRNNALAAKYRANLERLPKIQEALEEHSSGCLALGAKRRDTERTLKEIRAASDRWGRLLARNGQQGGAESRMRTLSEISEWCDGFGGAELTRGIYEKHRDLLAEVGGLTRGMSDFLGRCTEISRELGEHARRLEAGLRAGGGDDLRRRKELAASRLSGARRRVRGWGVLAGVGILLSAGAILARVHTLPSGAPGLTQSVLGAALLGFLWFVLSWWRLRRALDARARHGAAARELTEQIARSREECRRIDKVLASPERDGIVDLLELDDLSDPDLSLRIRSHRKSHADLASGGYAGAAQNLDRLMRQVQGALAEEIRTREKTMKAVGAELKKATAARDRAKRDTGEYQKQRVRMDAIGEKNRDLEDRAGAVRSQVEVYHAAMELLEETARSLRRLVGPRAATYLRQTLPELTDGRVRDLRIDENLDVRLFTGEKCDFLLGGELSGGMTRAVQLLLRLAVARVFIDCRIRQPSFVFLDEPFQGLDGARTVRALEVLKALGARLPQVFVVEPSFSEPALRLLDRSVLLQSGSKRLDLSLARAGPGGIVDGPAQGEPG